ncbi:unnamed protein product [Echinostoma caproni]|uniref:Guanylate cyclase domain-containing protein n=1 Tax=Echinostoma caproni TaxID=27848 RepID=A0A183AP05_9TREM|nr:unnamed protein product [Echinostoma caproni]
MQTSNTSYSGGLFQYFPFNGTDWIPILLHDGFSDTRIQFMLFLCAFFALVQLVLYIHYLFLVARKKFPRRWFAARKRKKQLAIERFCASNTGSVSDLEPCESCRSLNRRKDSCEWDFDVALDRLLRQNHVKCNPDEANAIMEAVVETKTGTIPQIVRKPFSERSRRSLMHRNVSSHVNSKSHRQRVVILSVVAAFFAICMTAHVTSLIVAIRTDHVITEALNALPERGHVITIQAERFLENCLDSTYDMIRVHIRNDAARIDNQSHLHYLVDRAKQLGSEAVACLIDPCMSNQNVSNEAIILFPQVSTNTSNEILADSLLATFNIVLSRLTALSEASVALNSQTIQITERAWYEYRQGLSRIVPFRSTWSEQISANDSWSSSVLVSRIYHTICSHLSHTLIFTSCEQVSTYLHSFVNYVNALPTMLPSKSLESVIQFASMPRVFHAEKLVKDWLPVVTDLPGQGVLFLLQTYLVPEINRLKTKLSEITATTPPYEVVEQFNRYTRVYASMMIITFTILVASGLLLLSVTCYFIFRACVQYHDWQDECYQSPTSHSSSFSTMRTTKTASSSCERSCRFLRWFTWILVMLICLVLVIVGTSIVYVSALIQNETCLYMFPGPAQNVADIKLTTGLSKLLQNLDKLKSLLETPYLNLEIPYPILKTFGSDYRPGQMPLLPSLHLNPPVNFSALLHSTWFNQTLNYLWHKDVREKLEQVDVASRLPKIQLEQIFNQVVKSMQLEKSFDHLNVASLNSYLNDPGPAYVVELRKVLLQIDTNESRTLANEFVDVEKYYKTYSQSYRIARENLVRIDQNKELIAPVRMLVSNASIALNRLNQLTTSQLIALIDQVITRGWPKYLPSIEKQLVPFLLRLLDDLIPFPGLTPIYQETIGILCPLLDNQSHPEWTLNFPRSSNVSFNPELDKLGTSLFISAMALMLASLCSLFVA